MHKNFLWGRGALVNKLDPLSWLVVCVCVCVCVGGGGGGGGGGDWGCGGVKILDNKKI